MTSPRRMTIDPREVRGGELHVVGDGDDRPSGIAEGADHGPDAFDAGGVLAGRGLVEDQDRRIHREHARERDQLAAREVQVVGIRRAHVGQPDRVEASGDELDDLVGGSAQVPWPERHLALDGPLEQLLVGVLEDESDRGRELVDRQAVGGRAAEQDLALGRSQQPVEMLGERGLARAVLAEDDHGLARLDGQRHAANGFHAVGIPMDQAVDLDRDGRSRRAGIPAAGPTRPRRRSAPAIRERATDARHAASPAAMAASSNSSPGATPARFASRTSVGGRRPTSRHAVDKATPGRSSATDRPSSSTRQRSIRPSTVGACSAHRIVVPLPARPSRRSATDVVPAGSSWAVGSSRTRTSVPIAMMLAMATRCCSPPDSENGSRSARSEMARRSRTPSMRGSISARGTPRFSSPKASSSRTVSLDAES